MKRLIALIICAHLAVGLYAQTKSSLFAAQNIGDSVMWVLGESIIPSPKGSYSLFSLPNAAVTSIWHTKMDVEVRAYPNPMTDVLYVNYPENWILQSCALYGVSGQNTGRQLVGGRIDVSGLPSGLYVLHLTFGKGGKYALKLIKR